MADAEDLKSGRHGRHENAPGALECNTVDSRAYRVSKTGTTKALQSLRTQRQIPHVGRSCRTRGRPTWTQLRDDYDEVLVPSVPEQHEQVEANVRLVQQKFG